MGPNPHWHSPKRTKTIVLVGKNLDDKAKARIFLPLASTPSLLKKSRTRIRTKKTYPTLSAILVSRKVNIPTSVPKKSQKTRVNLDNFYVGN